MNNGKICVSVCAGTVDELIRQINRAAGLADVIEIRFDCLNKTELNLLEPEKSEKILAGILDKRGLENDFLLTFRPREQGGMRELSRAERSNFWNGGFNGDWADLEEDMLEDSYNRLREKRICSYHDFEKVPENLVEIYERIKSRDLVDVVKIAVQTDDITDAIPLWKLLERWKADKEDVKAKRLEENTGFNRKAEEINDSAPPPADFLRIIPIAMGESGKWTRILGLAHGAFMTYAALGTGQETAPGQVSARDLIDVYRARELDETTGIYGILGSSVGVSLSPYIHNAAFRHHGLNAVFVPLQVHDLDAFMRRMVKPATREIALNFKGFSVTLPHKERIIGQLDELDETARRIGAVNTVRIDDGRLSGYNTDAKGFIDPLLDVYGDLKAARVAVLGAGGAARACVYALQTAGAQATVFARDPGKAKDLTDDFGIELKKLPASGEQAATYGDFDILVNTTPLGMKGKAEGETPASAPQLKGLRLVYDLVYTPFQTPLMTEADRAGVAKLGGLAMLVAQAVEQQRIWNGLAAPAEEMNRAALARLQ